jgi:hypothetical protein
VYVYVYVYVTGGIPYTDNIDKLHDLRAVLLEIFDEFGPEPESVEIPPGKGFARMKVCVCVCVCTCVCVYVCMCVCVVVSLVKVENV